jgi:glycosyltransferase involved in cell wall biosynthesis
MKIAIMMRAMDQDSGFRAYVEGLIDTLLRTDQENFYLLLYRTPKWFGRFSSFKNTKEVLLKAPHKFIWDQLVVPFMAWKEGADVIFNPKFSVPLISHCPVTMGIQPPDWWAWPQHYEWLDVQYQRLMLPLYIRKSAYLFPMSQFNLDETRKYVRFPRENMTVTYPGVMKQFRPIKDSSALDSFRRKHGLPERYILGLARVGHPGLDGSKSFYLGKNVDTTVRAFIQCRDQIPHHLVLTGGHVREYLDHAGFSGTDYDRIHTVGLLPYEDLPYVFNLADLVVIPSFYEGTSLTLMEAMACARPVVASQSGACPEVAGGATLLADPYDPSDFASKIIQVLTNDELRDTLSAKSLERSRVFTWERCARLTLEGLEQAVRR